MSPSGGEVGRWRRRKSYLPSNAQRAEKVFVYFGEKLWSKKFNWPTGCDDRPIRVTRRGSLLIRETAGDDDDLRPVSASYGEATFTFSEKISLSLNFVLTDC